MNATLIPPSGGRMGEGEAGNSGQDAPRLRPTDYNGFVPDEPEPAADESARPAVEAIIDAHGSETVSVSLRIIIGQLEAMAAAAYAMLAALPGEDL